MLALGFLFLGHASGERYFLGAGFLEEVVVAGVFDQLQLVQMDDGFGDVVEQIPIMADDDEGALIGF